MSTSPHIANPRAGIWEGNPAIIMLSHLYFTKLSFFFANRDALLTVKKKVRDTSIFFVLYIYFYGGTRGKAFYK